MQNLQITLGVDENDGFIASFYRLHEIELKVVGLACARRSRNEHVTFQITQW